MAGTPAAHRQSNVFATLSASNELASGAFEAIRLCADKRFTIGSQDDGSRASASATTGQDSASGFMPRDVNTLGSENNVGHASLSRHVPSSYLLSFRQPPRDLADGWVLGRPIASFTPDICLCLQSTYNVSPAHARLCFNEGSGLLCIVPYRATRCNGKPLASGKRYLLENGDTLYMGKLVLEFRYTAYRESAEFRAEFERLLTCSTAERPTVPITVASDISESLQQAGPYRIGSLVGRGFKRLIRGATLTAGEGNVLTAKVSQVVTGREDITNEFHVLQRLRGSHPNVEKHLESLQAVIGEPPTLQNINIFEPWVLLTLHQYVDRHEAELPVELQTVDQLSRCENPLLLPLPYYPEDLLQIFWQCFHGLGWLHSNGVTHRNINTDTIGIHYIGNELRITILDLEYATFEEESTDVHTGTFSETIANFRAPEILDIMVKKPDAVPYSTRVDLFSMGLVLAAVLRGKLCHRWARLNMEFKTWDDGNYVPLLDTILAIEYENYKLADLCRKLISTVPTSRPSAETTLGMFARHSEGLLIEAERLQGRPRPPAGYV